VIEGSILKRSHMIARQSLLNFLKAFFFSALLVVFCSRANAYEIMIAVKQFQEDNYIIEPPPRDVAERAAKAVRQELSKYPKSVLDKVLKKITLVGQIKLSVMGDVNRAVGLAGQGDIHLKIVDRENREEKAEKMIRYLHHEIFHLIEHYYDAHEFYLLNMELDQSGVRLPNDVLDPWENVNFKSFWYYPYENKGSLNSRGINLYCLPGFISHYATTAPNEDRAELFSAMTSFFPELQERVKIDSVLAKKVNILMRFLQDRKTGLNKDWFLSMSKRLNPLVFINQACDQKEQSLAWSKYKTDFIDREKKQSDYACQNLQNHPYSIWWFEYYSKCKQPTAQK
jgi:hypothetical protein